MKKLLRKWLGIAELDREISGLSNQLSAALVDSNELVRKLQELEKELGRCEQFIGALYDYLEVRPQRTFVQDYSRLPEEAIPTREVVKAAKVAPKKK